MPAMSYYNGQIVTPPDYVCTTVPPYQPPPPPPPQQQQQQHHTHHHQLPPLIPPPAYRYGGYAPPPPAPPALVPPPPPAPAGPPPPYTHQHHAAAQGAYRRPPTQYEQHSYSAHGTTYYLPQIPLDQAPPVNIQPMAPAARDYNSSKVTGGVSASLDYNIEDMATFLSGMAVSVMGTRDVGPEFQKFCNQVLSATRLPKATVILALVYLSKRWALGDVPDVDADSQTVYKMLVVAMLLANKFHDDNTFTNKSWQEATGLPVRDLTIIEKQWLTKVGWSLHLNSEEFKGWDKWDQCWQVFLNNRDGGGNGNAPVNNRYWTGLSTPPQQSSPETKYPPAFAIPKWYETANSQQNGQRLSGPSSSSSYNGDFSLFQHSYADQYHAPSAAAQQPVQSYYVNAYNSGSTCDCTMCAFEPARPRQGVVHPPPPPPPQLMPHHAARPQLPPMQSSLQQQQYHQQQLPPPLAQAPIGSYDGGRPSGRSSQAAVPPVSQNFPWFNAGIAAC